MKAFDRLKCAIRREIYLPKLQKRGLTVGKNFKMMGGCIIDPSHCWLITIGDNVTLAPRVHILAHDASTKFQLGYTKIAPVRIGDRSFIGAGSIILPGITIGNDVIIGAGSIVTKDVPSDSVVAGNPARIIISTKEYVEKMKKSMDGTKTFDSSYTIPYISEEKKAEMKSILDKNKIGFVE